MSRAPDQPPKPAKPIITIRDYIDAGLVVRSFCSSGTGHSHIVDLLALEAARGPDAVIDYAVKRSLTCPECGAAGGGLMIEQANQTEVSGHPKRNLPT